MTASSATSSAAPPEPETELPDVTAQWVHLVLGASVTGVRRFTRARQAWSITTSRDSDGLAQRWMLKGRRAPASVIARSRLLTEFGPAREAAAMQALAGTDILVPRLGGFDPVSAMLLMELVPGSALLQRLPGHERRTVMRHYAQQLAALHGLDWRGLRVGPSIPVPTSAEDMAVGGWLRAAEADAAMAGARLRHAEPLHDLARWWLHRSWPEGRDLDHLRLLHGDAGVNNFLFDDGRVTALIDWELVIIGDPMADLGNARYREALYPTGTYPDLIAEYEASSGRPVDRAAVSYYTALAATTLTLGMVANVHNPRASQPEAVARIWQDALARSVTCEAIAEAAGVVLDFDPRPLAATSSFDPFAELLAERLDRQFADAAPGQTAAESFGYARLAESLQLIVRSAAIVEQRFLDDATAILPNRPESVPAALAALAGLIAGPAGFDFPMMLSVLARDARRRLEVLRPLQRAEIWEDSSPVVTADGGAPDRPVLPGWRPAREG